MNHEEKEERRNMREEEGWREGKDKRKEGGRAIGRGGEEEREGGRVGKKEGGRTEGIMEGCREGGIRNREHLGSSGGVLEGPGGFRGVLEEFGERKKRTAEER